MVWNGSVKTLRRNSTDFSRIKIWIYGEETLFLW
jgi:hypothetical protein